MLHFTALKGVITLYFASAASCLWGLQQFRSIGSSLVTVFDWLNGGVDLTIFNGTHNPEIGLAMLLVYWFTMSMVLLNCLIAILADACSRVRSVAIEPVLRFCQHPVSCYQNALQDNCC